MAQLTATKVTALAKGKPSRTADSGGLYFIVPSSGSPFWAMRYTSAGRRKQMTLGSYPDLGLADARAKANEAKRLVKQGADPLAERQASARQGIYTMDDLFNDWYTMDISRRLKHPNIPKRIYEKNIQPAIGKVAVAEVKAKEIRDLLADIRDSGRPTIANDALGYLKQLFLHANKLDITQNNPAAAFKVTDAGGLETSRERALSVEEIRFVFAKFREFRESFGRDNYLACCLLVLLGVRKSELCQAVWSEFDLESKIWNLPKERSKSGVGLIIPLPDLATSWLKELKTRAMGSDYVFPARRASKQPHMGPDTLNRAIAKLFGIDTGNRQKPPNVMGDMEYFAVHDLRRTFRSLAASLKIPSHIAERCLNHKLKGVEGIYDRYDYLDERREALEKVAAALRPIL